MNFGELTEMIPVAGTNQFTQARKQDFELAYPNNIYPICDLLEHVKGLVLWNHSNRILEIDRYLSQQ